MNASFDSQLSAAQSVSAMTWKVSSPHKKRILLLDDDPAIRQVLLRLLADEDYCVSSAVDGAQALAFAATTRYDLVLLDLNAPDQSGCEAFNRITTDNPELPVVLITARPSQFFLALAAGVGVLLEKPFDLVKLFDTIRDLLQESPERQLAALSQMPSAVTQLPPAACIEAGKVT